MENESRFTEEVWKSWLEPFQAVRLLIEAGLDNREQAVSWLKGRLRNGDLRAGGWFMKLAADSLTKSEMVIGRYKVTTWAQIAAISWKDDFWVSGDYVPDDPLDMLDRAQSRGEFEHYLDSVRFDPVQVLEFCERSISQFPVSRSTEKLSGRAAGGRPPKPFWDALWAAIAAQLYNGDFKPDRQVDIENAMHEWLAANGEEAGETAVRAKAKLLFEAVRKEVEN